MRKRKQYLGMVMAILLIFTVCVQPVKAARPDCCTSKEWEVLRQTNEKRMKKGLNPFSTFAGLQSAADQRAKDIRKYFGHIRPDGSKYLTVLQNMSYTCCGENIAMGQKTATRVTGAWYNSKGHRKNMLSKKFVHMGVGYYYLSSSEWKYHWTQEYLGGCHPTSIEVDNKDQVITYDKGTTLKNMKRYLVVHCSHGNSYLPISNKMCTGYSKSTLGMQEVTVTYGGMKTTFTVNIV
ncbi:MAG: bacterial Ig-like domain-containing protein [Lachnospiraceae bacterium]|nr:bacterial Ig-like domain-containing protein [Lachnospiraceae bacterium]